MAYFFFNYCEKCTSGEADRKSGMDKVLNMVYNPNHLKTGKGGDLNWKRCSCLCLNSRSGYGSRDRFPFRQDPEPVYPGGVGGGPSAEGSAMVLFRMGGFFWRTADSATDLLDSFLYGGCRRRGCETVSGHRLSEWRKRHTLLYLFIFPVCGRNLSRQIAESQRA